MKRCLTEADPLNEFTKAVGLNLNYSFDDFRPRTPHIIIPGEPLEQDKNRTIVLPGQEEEPPAMPWHLVPKLRLPPN